MNRDAAVKRVRLVIERLVRDGSVVANSDGTEHSIFPVAVSPGECESLRNWVSRESATRTIEIGLGYGISALHICEGLLLNGNGESYGNESDSNSCQFRSRSNL